MTNDHAYPVAVDTHWHNGLVGRYWRVWSPWHDPHLIGAYASIDSAQRKADKLNKEHTKEVECHTTE